VRRDGELRRATWPEAFAALETGLQGLDGSRIGAVAGNLADAESMLALKDLMAELGSANLDCRQDGAYVDPTRRDFYLFNTSIAGIEESDAILIVGSNPRREAPLINARIRKRWLQGGVPIALIGPAADLTYAAQVIGAGPETITALLEGRHGFADTLKGAKHPMLILGQGALARPDGADVLAACWRLAAATGMLVPDWHGFNVLHTAAARAGALDLGFLPGPAGKPLGQMLGGGVGALWLLGADELNTAAIGRDTFVIYQGSHGDRGAARADVILPGAAYTEKNGTYVNTEGRVQRGALAVFPPGDAREDWKILRAFSAFIDRPLPYDDIGALRARLEQVNPVFARIDLLPRSGARDPTGPAGDPARMRPDAFLPWIDNYYQTDPISRASPTMAECAREHVPAPAQAAE
jgi:NADH-quinone oxidoreductase subunit G